ncbi:hypothetical protein Btru_068215 [Bulinus truncatus]|nr:hypothetical protein Btru_068215 [Bulinus truncatus]
MVTTWAKKILLFQFVPPGRHWTVSVLNGTETLTIYVTVYNATCADSGLYQCAVHSGRLKTMVRLEELVLDQTVYNVDQVSPQNMYCPLYHHEAVMSVFMASLELTNVFQCDVFIGGAQLYRKVVKVSVHPDPVASKMIDRSIEVSDSHPLQLNCSSRFFGIKMADLLTLEVYRSSTPETSIVSYRRDEPIFINGIEERVFSILPHNWSLETNCSSDAITFNLRVTRPTCQDSGWYRCVACSGPGDTPTCQAVRVDIDVDGDPSPMYQNEIKVLECEGKEKCVVDEGTRINIQCETVKTVSHKVKNDREYTDARAQGHIDAKILWTSSQNIQYNVSKSLRTAKYMHHKQCEIFDYMSRVTVELATPKLLTRFTCRFYRGDDLISTEYADIYANTESNKILSPTEVVDGGSFSINCSTGLFNVLPGDVDVLEISRESKPKSILACHIRNLKQPLEFHKPLGRNWDIKVNYGSESDGVSHLSLTLTVVESKCVDSGWYQCSVKLTESDHVMTQKGHVRVTAKEAYSVLDVLQCRGSPVCSLLAKETFDIICNAVGPVNAKIQWYFENSTELHNISEMTIPVNITDKVEGRDVQVEYCETRYRYVSTLTVYRSTVSRWFVCQLWTNQSNVVSRKIFVTVRETSKGNFLASGNRIFFFAPMIFFVISLITVAGYLIYRRTSIFSPLLSKQFASRRMALNDMDLETTTSLQDDSLTVLFLFSKEMF